MPIYLGTNGFTNGAALIKEIINTENSMYKITEYLPLQ
jgi:hypothetical protein